MRKFIPISPETHAQLTALVGEEMVKNRGQRFTYDAIIKMLLKLRLHGD